MGKRLAKVLPMKGVFCLHVAVMPLHSLSMMSHRNSLKTPCASRLAALTCPDEECAIALEAPLQLLKIEGAMIESRQKTTVHNDFQHQFVRFVLFRDDAESKRDVLVSAAKMPFP